MPLDLSYSRAHSPEGLGYYYDRLETARARTLVCLGAVASPLQGDEYPGLILRRGYPHDEELALRYAKGRRWREDTLLEVPGFNEVVITSQAALLDQNVVTPSALDGVAERAKRLMQGGTVVGIIPLEPSDSAVTGRITVPRFHGDGMPTFPGYEFTSLDDDNGPTILWHDDFVPASNPAAAAKYVMGHTLPSLLASAITDGPDVMRMIESAQAELAAQQS